MNLRTSSRVLLAALVLMFVASNTSSAQVSLMAFSSTQGTWVPITAGTQINPGYVDDNSFLIPIGFTFNFGGNSYTDVWVNSNGGLSFGASQTYDYLPLAYPSAGVTGSIVAIGGDLLANNAGDLMYELTGPAGNRVLTVQYTAFDWYSSQFYGMTNQWTWQFKLYEKGAVEIVWGPFVQSPVYTIYGWETGIRGASSTDFHRRVVDYAVVGSTWANSTQAPTNDPYTYYTSIGPNLIPAAGLTYRWACNIPDNAVQLEVLNMNDQPATAVELPGSVKVAYNITYPDLGGPIDLTVKFYRVGQAVPEYVYGPVSLVKAPLTPLVGTLVIALPTSLPMSWYRVDVVVSMANQCNIISDNLFTPGALLIYPQGTPVCKVWPGDVNNDGLVNYGDRKSLNSYIYDANMRTSWLNGYARYRISANPLSYTEWIEQAGLPWGNVWNGINACYVDADGNGYINNFDYVAIKLNWMRSHSVPKQGDQSLLSFDMVQNYPNPFNPTTRIQYSTPEKSQVSLVVTDMIGRTIATLVNGNVTAGVHDVSFDASSLTSGTYIATVNMIGLESGLTFSRTMKMQFVK